uniref:ATP synthase membrane subunit f n=1 Tax=Anolis carolinensis TaxID=28377 RepID=A0A803T0U7_ANOCA|nr:PREDICTED: uncharacterized protein C17orf80 homolog isoform X1 [Anolis carolinensis]XP_008102312.1 PREDICTED: uncharacterized protein C17orf80 homolog isoform X1 [Anolis carolinensis]XP_008102314.1 PREDICTED: uncharacterized protein C17orf80 homolog isoform X1 [Anolis carolinensis]XP_016846730.1 PREDICTED: uncharacterized protein C17orf80 homolog isoform X1 [Anolis carolinensis]|eukprot:XP_008102311.1 PREDICTED: uncharacterized protein C17orf80 homolog isoform X1 [Anolis carolinensis]
MASSPPGTVICPFCKKPFKRLKSHLPHCKMAGDPDSRDGKVYTSVVPESLSTEKKGKIESTETASKNKRKKSKTDLTRNKTTKSLDLKIAGMASSSSFDTQMQMEPVTKKTNKTKGNEQSSSKEVSAHPAEKVVSEITLAKHSSTMKKGRSEMTFEGNEFAPGLALEPLTQNRNPASDPLNQTAKLLVKHTHGEEGFEKQNVSGSPDSSTEDLQPFPQGITDRIELVIENHQVRVLRNRPSVQNSPLHENAATKRKIYQWPVKPSPEGEKTDSTNGQQVVMLTQSGAQMSALGLAEDVGHGQMGEGITAVKAHIVPDMLPRGNGKKISSNPLQLATGVKTLIDKDPLFFKRKSYPIGSHVCTNPKSQTCDAFAKALEKKDDKTYLTSPEKGTALPSGTLVTPGYNTLEIPLRAPALHLSERTIVCGFSLLDRCVEPRSLGLEFFPELYPNYLSLGLFSRRPQWNVRIPGPQVLILPSEGEHVPLAERCLMDVKLHDLPAWLATRDLSPQGMLGVTCRAWNRYYNKYINVKKGGVGGIAMLLLGYCVLSYAWTSEHIKQSRWRKYH